MSMSRVDDTGGRDQARLAGVKIFRGNESSSASPNRHHQPNHRGLPRGARPVNFRPPGPGRGPYRPVGANERPLMRARGDDDQPLRTFAVEIEVPKFNAVPDVSVAEESGLMVVPRVDRELISATPEPGDIVNDAEVTTRWSNPDPYSGAPPLAAPVGKAKDIINMITKSRREIVPGGGTNGKNVVESNADFISFDMEIEKGESATLQDAGSTEAGEITQQEASAGTLGTRTLFAKLDTAATNGPIQSSAHSVINRAVTICLDGSSEDENHRQPNGWHAVNRPAPASSGKRNRASDSGADELEFFTDDDSLSIDSLTMPSINLQRPPRHRSSHLPTTKPWRQKHGAPNMPWLDHPTLPIRQDVAIGSPSIRLHKEICAFSDYTKPTPKEAELRAALMRDLYATLRNKFPECQLRAFGSYAAELYLPDSDMDLVLVTSRLLHRGISSLVPTRCVHKLRGCLSRLAATESVIAIPKARVPLVKYKDARTGIKVDVSFEQLNGVNAVNTLKEWLSELPALEPLIRVIKQFLAMRGMNEVFNGGLGGFSTICLVVCFLQNLPITLLGGGPTLSSHHLGDLLLWFFEFYGKSFDPNHTAIVWYTPSTGGPKARFLPVSDASLSGILPREFFTTIQSGRSMVLVDPNNPSNNLTIGSKRIADIFEDFSEAVDLIKAKMQHVLATGEKCSILEPVLGGDYSSWIDARRRYAAIGTRVPNGLPARPYSRPAPALHAPSQSIRNSKVHPEPKVRTPRGSTNGYHNVPPPNGYRNVPPPPSDRSHHSHATDENRIRREPDSKNAYKRRKPSEQPAEQRGVGDIKTLLASFEKSRVRPP